MHSKEKEVYYWNLYNDPSLDGVCKKLEGDSHRTERFLQQVTQDVVYQLLRLKIKRPNEGVNMITSTRPIISQHKLNFHDIYCLFILPDD